MEKHKTIRQKEKANKPNKVGRNKERRKKCLPKKKIKKKKVCAKMILYQSFLFVFFFVTLFHFSPSLFNSSNIPLFICHVFYFFGYIS